MSIIQTLREKAGWLLGGLIAISLIGFLLMDARRSNFFSGDRGTAVGVVDGKKIQVEDFDREVNALEENVKRSQGSVSDEVRGELRDEIWRQDVQQTLVKKDCAALGLTVGKNEENDLLAGSAQDVDPTVLQWFRDPKTGRFDPQVAAQNMNQIFSIYKAGPRRATTPEQQQQYDQARTIVEDLIPQFIERRLEQKYIALFANSAYVPKWMAEKTNADNSQRASASFVNTPYYTIPDSSVKVSDAEITDYINQHPEEFKQDESRSIAYVTFDASPTKADSDRVRDQLVELSKEFATTKDPKAFLDRVGSETSFADTTIARSMIHVPFKDSILALPKGGLYGPYLDQNDYVIAKLIDERQVPDTVRARHILVATIDPQTKQPIIEDSTAKKKIDSIRNLIEKGGQRFDSVAAHLSDDISSRVKGGDVGWFGPNQMVPEFQDFAFGHKVGDKGIVKSNYGYHYIEVTGQRNFEPGYKIAYLNRRIDASQETDNAASGLASQFAGNSRDARAFDENALKQHLQRQIAPDIAPTATAILGLGPNRDLVRWIYGADLGNVSQPFSVGSKYVVALLTEINKAGTMSASKARPRVEPILRNRKKAELITKKLGNPATLDAAASASGQPIMHADSIDFASGTIPNAGREPKVVGACFDKALAGKPASPAIAGNGGVFVIRVDKVFALSNPNGDIQQQRFTMEQQEKQVAVYQLIDQMRKLAKITDNRGKFF